MALKSKVQKRLKTPQHKTKEVSVYYCFALWCVSKLENVKNFLLDCTDLESEVSKIMFAAIFLWIILIIQKTKITTCESQDV